MLQYDKKAYNKQTTYHKQTAFEEFSHSCLGRLAILAVILFCVFLVALILRPSDSKMIWQTEDNIRECLLASDNIQSDIIDDYVGNIGRILTHADSAEVDAEQWAVFRKYNTLRIYSHPGYKTAYIHNNVHPEGVRVGIGIFGIVIPTVKYADMLLNTGTVRGEYGEQLIHKSGPADDNSAEMNTEVELDADPEATPDDDSEEDIDKLLEDKTSVQPFHYGE